MKKISILLLVLLLGTGTVSAQTSNNDDSCDVAALPAATLLLPYFEVDLTSPVGSARTTLFTIINTTRLPQVANVTVWTDWAYPALSFDVFLTGYDVQALNLADILRRGFIAPSGNPAATPGSRSVGANPKLLADANTTCARPATSIPQTVLSDIQAALTTGAYPNCGLARVGGTHANATGYVTVDLVASCRATLPTDSAYFGELLYDNVLTGDWEIISPNAASGNFASGNPLVHIRAIPEGGNAGEVMATNLPYTFYDRFSGSGARRRDRRQPLPSSFAARYIQGGGTGFNTDFLIWREGVTAAGAVCSEYVQNSRGRVAGVVRFDERENPTASIPGCGIACGPSEIRIPAAASVPTQGSAFPPLTSGDVAGWMALSLDNFGSSAYGVAPERTFAPGDLLATGPRPSQNWIVPMLSAEGRYSAAFDATALANGCSPALPTSNDVITIIGPGANVNP